MNIVMAIEKDVGRMGRQGLGRIFSNNHGLSGGLADADRKPEPGQFAFQPLDGLFTILVVAGVSRDRRKAQELEQPSQACGQAPIDLAENVFECCHGFNENLPEWNHGYCHTALASAARAER